MNYYVNTKTQEEYDELMDILDSQGKKWRDGDALFKLNFWSIYKEKTVISIHDTISYRSIIMEEGPIISLEEYKQIVNSEKPKIAEQTEETFIRGELVEVSSDKKIWEDRIFLVEIKGALFPYFCVNDRWEENYKEEEDFGVTGWRFIRKKPKTIEIDGKKFSLKQVKEAIKNLTPIE